MLNMNGITTQLTVLFMYWMIRLKRWVHTYPNRILDHILKFCGHLLERMMIKDIMNFNWKHRAYRPSRNNPKYTNCLKLKTTILLVVLILSWMISFKLWVHKYPSGILYHVLGFIWFIHLNILEMWHYY